MAGDEPKPSSPLGPLGGAVGGSAVGLGLGLSLGHGELPLQTFQWVLDKGVAGLLLVACFLLGYLYLAEKKLREEEKERLYRELIDTVAPVRVALDQTRTALLRSDETLHTERGEDDPGGNHDA